MGCVGGLPCNLAHARLALLEVEDRWGSSLQTKSPPVALNTAVLRNASPLCRGVQVFMILCRPIGTVG